MSNIKNAYVFLLDCAPFPLGLKFAYFYTPFYVFFWQTKFATVNISDEVNAIFYI